MGGLALRPAVRGLALGAGLLLAVMVAAAPAQAARSWGPPLQLSSPGATVDYADVANTGKDGDVAAVWVEQESSEVKGAVVADGSDDFEARTLGPGTLGPDALVESPTGGAVAAWVDWRDARLKVAEVDPGARAIGDPLDLGPADAEGLTAVAANDAGGYIAAFVRDGDSGPELWAVRRPHGGDWGAPYRVTTVTPTQGWKRRIVVGLAHDGRAVFAWADEVEPDRMQIRAVSEAPDGSIGDVQTLSSAERDGWTPHLAIDALGDAVVTWVEVDHGEYYGPLYAAVSLPTGQFRPPVPLLGRTFLWDGAQVRAGELGNAVAVWTQEGGWPVQSAGVLAAGVFTPPLPLAGDLENPMLAGDRAGNAVIAGTSEHTMELRLIRRSAIGLAGWARTVTCEGRPGPVPADAAIGDDGDIALLWREVEDEQPHALFLERDSASKAFSPDPCPRYVYRPPLAYSFSPREPDPGDDVTFDASGWPQAYPDRRFTFSWDFDGDGDYEVTSADPVVHHTFAEAGEHSASFRVSWTHADGPDPYLGWDFTVPVGLPHAEDPPDLPSVWEQRPPDIPDENPWPLVSIPPIDIPPVDVPPVDVPPVDLPPTQPGGTQDAGGVPGGLLAQVPARMRRRAALERGVPVTLTASRPLTASVRVLVMRSGARRLAGTASAALAHGRSRVVRVPLTPWARRTLAGRAHRRVFVEVRGGARGALRRTVSLVD